MEMLLDVAKENGLVQLPKSPLPDIKDHYEPGDRLSWWSRLDLNGQTAYLLHSWKSSFRWDDLEGTHYRAWDPYAWKPMAGREILLKHLAQLHTWTLVYGCLPLAKYLGRRSICHASPVPLHTQNRTQ